MPNEHSLNNEESPEAETLDWVLQKVQEPMEHLRALHNDVDALAASVHRQVQEMIESRPNRAYGDPALRQLLAVTAMQQEKASEAYQLSAVIATAVDRGITSVSNGKGE